VNDMRACRWPRAAVARPGRETTWVNALVWILPALCICGCGRTPDAGSAARATACRFSGTGPHCQTGLRFVTSDEYISVTSGGTCVASWGSLPCGSVGPELRRRYPTSEPTIHVCLDAKTNYEAASAALQSLEKSKLFRTKTTCARDARRPKERNP
jgi:hypothetical protein